MFLPVGSIPPWKPAPHPPQSLITGLIPLLPGGSIPPPALLRDRALEAYGRCSASICPAKGYNQSQRFPSAPSLGRAEHKAGYKPPQGPVYPSPFPNKALPPDVSDLCAQGQKGQVALRLLGMRGDIRDPVPLSPKALQQLPRSSQ